MASTINASNSGSGGIVQTADASGVLQLQSAGTTAVTIDTSQNVGIGVTSPTTKAQVSTATGGSTSGLSVVASGNMLNIFGSSSTNAGVILDATNGTVGSATAVPIIFRYGGTESMRIDSSGNVGIGTNAPSTKLQVAIGNVSTFGQVSNAGLAISGAGATGNYAQIGLGYAATNQPAAIGYVTTIQTGYTYGDIVFGTRNVNTDTAPSERARITSGGDFYIANTTVDSTHAGWVLSYNGGSPFINHSQTATSLQTYYAFTNGNGVVGTIKCTGSSTQFNTSSDVRLKKNVVDAPSAIASIQQIGIKSFDWKADDLHQEYGVIAQELDAIAPEAVSHGGTEDEMWGVDYSKLVPRMIKAMQEQAETINALTARVVALESK